MPYGNNRRITSQYLFSKSSFTFLLHIKTIVPYNFKVYFQRVLSSKSSSGAQKLSFVAGVGCILMAIPPALIGAIARNTGYFLTFFFSLFHSNLHMHSNTKDITVD